jgi:hypothetical protein
VRRKTRELPGSGVVKAPMPVVLSEVDFLDTVIVAAAAAGLTRVMLPCGISPKSRRFRAVLLNAADRHHQTPQLPVMAVLECRSPLFLQQMV